MSRYYDDFSFTDAKVGKGKPQPVVEEDMSSVWEENYGTDRPTPEVERPTKYQEED